MRVCGCPRRPRAARRISARCRTRRSTGRSRSSPSCACGARPPPARAAGTRAPDVRLRSLRSRIVFFFVALLVAVQGIALLLVNAANERNARDHIRQELAVGERIFRRLLEQNHARLAQAAELLSLDYAFREAAATRDLPTMHSMLANHGSRIGADKMALVSLDGQVLADTLHPKRSGQRFQPARLLQAAEQEGRATGMVHDEGRAFQVAVLPVLAPTP